MRISPLALDGLWDTGLTVMLDAFTLANNFSTLQMGGTPHFDVSIVGVRRRVRSGQGWTIPVKAIAPRSKPDWVIVPALNTGRPAQLVSALQRRDVSDATLQLKRRHAKGVHIAASCIGSFVLAEAGLLEHLEATTTWWLAPLFDSAIPMSCSTSLECLCHRARWLLLGQQWDILILHSG